MAYFFKKIKNFGLYLKVLFAPCDDNNYRPKILEGRYLVYLLLLAVFLRLSAFIFFWQLPNTSFFADISKMVLIESLNQERAGLNLGTLKENSLLTKAAGLKAQDMMKYGYFSHTSPAGLTPWYWFKKVGYNYVSAGENLGIGFVDSAELHQAWNDSPSHKANLLNGKYKEVGIDFLEGDFNGAKTTIVVQLFGTQKTAVATKPVVAVKPKPATSTPQLPSGQSTSSGGNLTISNQGTANVITNNLSTTGSAVAGAKTDIVISATSGLAFVSTTSQDDSGVIQGFWAGVLKFFAKDYSGLGQKLILIFLAINIIALILNIVIKIFTQHYDLILKSSLFAIALLLLLMVGQDKLLALIHPYTSIF